jgi:hypothetical protein
MTERVDKLKGLQVDKEEAPQKIAAPYFLPLSTYQLVNLSTSSVNYQLSTTNLAKHLFLF